jgi:hypothetical protein|tara:strand:- start:1040 stop:1387 length:348 start_codon:yes stop_codon:yes gene_type:complete
MSDKTPTLTPQQVSVLRGKISQKMTKNLTMAQEVLQGKREWTPTQARVFSALLNKVIPDVSMQYAQVDVQTKEASNLTRKELEEIASGIYEVAKVEEDEQTEGLSKLDDQSKEES